MEIRGFCPTATISENTLGQCDTEWNRTNWRVACVASCLLAQRTGQVALFLCLDVLTIRGDGRGGVTWLLLTQWFGVSEHL